MFGSCRSQVYPGGCKDETANVSVSQAVQSECGGDFRHGRGGQQQREDDHQRRVARELHCSRGATATQRRGESTVCEVLHTILA